jgi:hypothetical protein
MTKPIFFDHVPKAAGTAVIEFLAAAMGIKVKMSSDTEEALLYVKRNINEKLISGHFWFRLGQEIFGLCRCFTILREPLDRVISEFYYWKGNTDGQNENVYSALSMTFEEYLEYSDLQGFSSISNFQTKHFAPLGGFNDDVNISLEEKCRMAKAALDRFELVGVHELVSPFYHMMCRLVGLPGTKNLGQVNVTRKRPRLLDIDRSLIKRMEALNEADIELYRYARGLFLKSLKEIIVSIPSRAEHIKKDICHATDSTNTNLPATQVSTCAKEFGSRGIYVKEISITGELSHGSALLTGENAVIHVLIVSKIDSEDTTVGIYIRDIDDNTIYGVNTHALNMVLNFQAGQQYMLDFRLRSDLGVGDYKVGAALHLGKDHLTKCFHWVDDLGAFSVIGNMGHHYVGSTKLYPIVSAKVITDGNVVPIELKFRNSTSHQLLTYSNPPLEHVAGFIDVINNDNNRNVLAGRTYTFQVKIKNIGQSCWPSTGRQAVYLSYHWLAPDGQCIDYEGVRTPLPNDVHPLEEISMTFALRTPSMVGPAELHVTLIQENCFWFEERGFTATKMRFVIQS